MAKIQDIDIPYLEFAEAAAPGTPAAGIVRQYAKSDGLLYSKDDAGAETLVSGGATGASVTGGEVLITANVTMTNANQFYDGPSQSLAAGTYLVWGAASVENANVDTFMTLRLWDGTNVFHEAEEFQKGSGEASTLNVFAYVVLGATTTVKISAACNKASGTINDMAQTNGTADKGTKLMWLKIA